LNFIVYLYSKHTFRKADLLPSSGVETNLSGRPLTSYTWSLSSSFYGTRAVRRTKTETKPASETFNYKSTTDSLRKGDCFGIQHDKLLYTTE